MRFECQYNNNTCGLLLLFHLIFFYSIPLTIIYIWDKHLQNTNLPYIVVTYLLRVKMLLLIVMIQYVGFRLFLSSQDRFLMMSVRMFFMSDVSLQVYCSQWTRYRSRSAVRPHRTDFRRRCPPRRRARRHRPQLRTNTLPWPVWTRHWEAAGVIQPSIGMGRRQDPPRSGAAAVFRLTRLQDSVALRAHRVSQSDDHVTSSMIIDAFVVISDLIFVFLSVYICYESEWSIQFYFCGINFVCNCMLWGFSGDVICLVTVFMLSGFSGDVICLVTVRVEFCIVTGVWYI